MKKSIKELIEKKIENLAYGEIRIVVHNGKIQYIEDREKTKIQE